MIIMNKAISIKLSGQQPDLRDVIKVFYQNFDVTINSRFIPNQERDGVHVYVTILPKQPIVESQPSPETRK